MSNFLPSSYFDVSLGGEQIGLSGQFVSVSGLGMEYEYETYTEGGSNYPRRFFKSVVPQTLVLEQGTLSTPDKFYSWVNNVNLGIRESVAGVITLKDHTGASMRSWQIEDALVVKYIGPELNSNQAQLAVTRIELSYNGCA